jgi:hypothetical protein
MEVSHMAKRIQRQWKSKEELVKMVGDLRKTGLTAKEACEKVGCGFAYYYAVKREMGEGRNPMRAPVVKSDDLVSLRDLTLEEFIRYSQRYEKLTGKEQ